MLRTRKIRFIEPRGRQGRPFNAWISHWPLLGPITLATILHNRGFDVQVYNENISGSLDANPRAFEEVCSADVVGISIMTPTASRGYALAKAIRGAAPAATIVFGGVHASFLPQEAIQHGDIVVCGEGESVIEAIARGDVTQGIVRAQPLGDLDAIPTLNHALMRDFDKLLIGSRRAELYELPIMTSRGCPYGCTYCSVTSMFGRKVRRQSVQKVHSDLCRYMDLGYQRFFFYDDNFTADGEWSKQLLGRAAPLKIKFNAQTRVDFHWRDGQRTKIDRDLLAAMRRAGADVLYVGYETIDDATARQWHKGYSGQRQLRVRLMEDTRILHDNGFWIHAMFVLGPQHTRSTAKQIVDFSLQGKLETMQISILTPFPGTALFEQMRPQLAFTEFPSDWDFYDGTHCVYNKSRLSVEEFQKTILQAHRRFYRWGVVNFRRLRAVLQAQMPLRDKLAKALHHARIARTTLRQWRQETAAFLELAKARRIELLGT